MPQVEIQRHLARQWGRVAELIANDNPIRFANAFVKQFESKDTWLEMENPAFQALGLATKAEPAGVWAIIAKAMMRQDSTGHKLLLKLSHWYGESIPPEVRPGGRRRTALKGSVLRPIY